MPNWGPLLELDSDRFLYMGLRFESPPEATKKKTLNGLRRPYHLVVLALSVAPAVGVNRSSMSTANNSRSPTQSLPLGNTISVVARQLSTVNMFFHIAVNGGVGQRHIQASRYAYTVW